MNDPQTITLRPVQPEDDPFLLRVYGSTREAELSLTGWSDDQKEAFLRMQLMAQRLSYEGQYPDARYDIVLADGAEAGRIWVARMENQIRLLDIALLPEHQNRGIGTSLLQDLIWEAAEAGLPLCHMVDKMNPDALRFYQRLGFSVVGEVPSHFTMERLPGTLPSPPDTPTAVGG